MFATFSLNQTVIAAILGMLLIFTQPVAADSHGSDRESVAVIALNLEANSIERGNALYTVLIANLQKKMRNANHLVSNLLLPVEKEPNWSNGIVAVGQAVEALESPTLATVVLVDATSEYIDAETTKIQLTYEFYDTREQTVYRKFSAEATVSGAVCADRCENISLIKEFRKLDHALSTSLVASLNEVELPAIAKTN